MLGRGFLRAWVTMILARAKFGESLGELLFSNDCWSQHHYLHAVRDSTDVSYTNNNFHSILILMQTTNGIVLARTNTWVLGNCPSSVEETCKSSRGQLTQVGRMTIAQDSYVCSETNRGARLVPQQLTLGMVWTAFSTQQILFIATTKVKFWMKLIDDGNNILGLQFMTLTMGGVINDWPPRLIIIKSHKTKLGLDPSFRSHI